MLLKCKLLKKYITFDYIVIARMSTAFCADSILDQRSPQLLQIFVETNLRPQMGLMRVACAGEVENFIDLIQKCCPITVTRLIKVVPLSYVFAEFWESNFQEALNAPHTSTL